MTPTEQARADALADAETLRLYWPLRDRAKTNVGKARRAGGSIAATRPWLGVSDETLAEYARRAARFAFRAVPGLRG